MIGVVLMFGTLRFTSQNVDCGESKDEGKRSDLNVYNIKSMEHTPTRNDARKHF